MRTTSRVPDDPPPLYWENAELGVDPSGRVFRRGGPRPNAGRKPSGRKPFLIRLKPAAHARLLHLARSGGFRSLGAYLESIAATAVQDEVRPE